MLFHSNRNPIVSRSILLAVVLLSLCGCGSIKRALYAPEDRGQWQQTERVITSLGIQAGAHVADLGAGGGYFTFPLAKAVGPLGKVYAVDVDPDMTRYLEQRAASEGYDNVEVILAEPADPHPELDFGSKQNQQRGLKKTAYLNHIIPDSQNFTHIMK